MPVRFKIVWDNTQFKATICFLSLGLDPSLVGWTNNLFRFRPNDGIYTEVIHTNTGVNGFLADLAHVDFYPNGGISMPGCSSNACDHARSFFYFAESLATEGFTGQECHNFYLAVAGRCNTLPGRLGMGGLKPKNGLIISYCNFDW